MDGQGGDAAILGDTRNVERVALITRPAGANLKGYRYRNRGNHGAQDRFDQLAILQ